MRVATRCATVEEFITGFQPYCDGATCFIPTLGMRPVGLETAFAIQLVDGKPMLRGMCAILDAWMTAENPFGRPGLRVKLLRLTADSNEMLGRLREARSATPKPVVETATAPIETSSVVVPASAAIAPLAPLTRGTDEFATPTLENPVPAPVEVPPAAAPIAAAAPPVERTPGAAFVLPANPLTALSDESLGAFVDCMLYEELGGDDDPMAFGDVTDPDQQPAMLVDVAPMPEPSSALKAILASKIAPAAAPRETMGTLLGVPPLVKAVTAPPPVPPPVPVPVPVPVPAPVPVLASVVPPDGSTRWGIVIGIAGAVIAIAALVWIVAIRGSSVAQAQQPSAPTPTPTSPTPVAVEARLPPPMPPAPTPVAPTPTPPPAQPPSPDEPKPAAACAMSIASTPTAATVWIDGKEAGRTPMKLDTTCGSHVVGLIHPGYKNLVRTLTPTLAQPVAVELTMRRPPMSPKKAPDRINL